MEKLQESCLGYISGLRMIYLLHQNHHWICSGNDFYGNHLLFERIYTSAQENADAAAEKFVGLFGKECLDLSAQAESIAKMLKTFCGDDYLESSLRAEEFFLKYAQEFFDSLKASEDMTLGLDDLLMSISNTREEAIYLLKQALGEDNMNKKISSLATRFQKKLAQVQAPDLTPEQIRSKIDNANLEISGDKVIAELADSLALKNMQPNDISFSELKLVTTPDGKQAVSWRMNVSPTFAQQFNAAVAKNKETQPAFSVGRYVSQLMTRYFPNMPILPAQPITVG